MRLGNARFGVAVEACSGTVVSASAPGAEGGRTAAVRRLAWMVGAGAAILGVGMAVRPFGIAAIGAAVLAVLLYGALAADGRGSGA
jgi:hypothetical protein